MKILKQILILIWTVTFIVSVSGFSVSKHECKMCEQVTEEAETDACCETNIQFKVLEIKNQDVTCANEIFNEPTFTADEEPCCTQIQKNYKIIDSFSCTPQIPITVLFFILPVCISENLLTVNSFEKSLTTPFYLLRYKDSYLSVICRLNL